MNKDFYAPSKEEEEARRAAEEQARKLCEEECRKRAEEERQKVKKAKTDEIGPIVKEPALTEEQEREALKRLKDDDDEPPMVNMLDTGIYDEWND